jgi:hypothetical protein
MRTDEGKGLTRHSEQADEQHCRAKPSGALLVHAFCLSPPSMEVYATPRCCVYHALRSTLHYVV